MVFNHIHLILALKVLTTCLCFWDNHLGSKDVKNEEMSNTTDEHSVGEKLDLVKEVKPSHPGTSNRNTFFFAIVSHNCY